MGNIRLNKVLSMTKATVSFWFRVPSELITEIAQREEAMGFWDFTMLQSMVPLLMFGAQQNGQVYDFGGAIIGYLPYSDPVYSPDPVPIPGIVVTGSHLAPLMPSCIAVQFGEAYRDGRLVVHLQTSDYPVGENLAAVAGAPLILEYDDSGNWTGNWRRSTVDVTYTRIAHQDYFGNADSGYRDPETGNEIVINLKCDEWHHILISWDLSAGSRTHGNDEPSTIAAGTDAFSLMWCAVDDVKYDGNELPAQWMEGGNANAHLSIETVGVATQDNRWGPASASLSVSQIPTNPMTIPAPAELDRANGPTGETTTIDAGQKVEMAELQIWCDTTLDVGLVTNRRAFIDYDRDDDGNPIVDQDGNRTLKPVDPKRAETLLGKRPDILLHKTSNWQKGKNTGSIGTTRTDEAEVIIPDGQLTPTGTILKYKPDPSLTEPAG